MSHSWSEDVELALQKLREARELLKGANAPNTLARVRHAISSCRGAVRNASYRDARPRKQIHTAKARNRVRWDSNVESLARAVVLARVVARNRRLA